MDLGFTNQDKVFRQSRVERIQSFDPPHLELLMEVQHVQPVHLRHQYTTSVELLEKVQCFLYCQIRWTTPSATFSNELVNTVPEVSTIYLLYLKDIS